MNKYLSPLWQRDHISDDIAFRDNADPKFPWIRVVFGEKPKLPPGTKYVYVLRAHGKTTKNQVDRVAWYVAGRGYPQRTRPIAYIVVDAGFNPVERISPMDDGFPPRLPDEKIAFALRKLLHTAGAPVPDLAPGATHWHVIEHLYGLVQNLPGSKLDGYGEDFAAEWEFIHPHASARLNEGPNYKLGKRVLDNMKQIRDHKE